MFFHYCLYVGIGCVLIDILFEVKKIGKLLEKK